MQTDFPPEVLKQRCLAFISRENSRLDKCLHGKGTNREEVGLSLTHSSPLRLLLARVAQPNQHVDQPGQQTLCNHTSGANPPIGSSQESIFDIAYSDVTQIRPTAYLCILHFTNSQDSLPTIPASVHLGS